MATISESGIEFGPPDPSNIKLDGLSSSVLRSLEIFDARRNLAISMKTELDNDEWKKLAERYDKLSNEVASLCMLNC